MLLVSYATLLWAAFLQWTAASPVEWQGAAPLVKPFANARYKRQAQTSIPAPQPPPPEAYATAMPGLSPISDYRQQKYLDPSKDTEWWYYTGADGGQPGSIRMKLNAQVPAVALDHSTWITDVSCSGSVIITGKFTRTTAYDYAVKQWSNKKDVHFVSAAATCSPDGQNAWFAVQGLTFDEKSQTFTAQCTPTTIQDVWSNMNLDFGPNMNMQGIGMTGLPPRPESTSTFKEPIKGTATALTTPTANGYGAPTESPTAQIIRGLPAVAAGAGFDQRLDDRLAYYYAGGNVSEQDVLAMASGTNIMSRSLDKRGVFDFFVDLGQGIINTAANFGSALLNTGAAVINAAKLAVTVVAGVAKALVQFIVTGQYSNSQTFNVKLKPDGSVFSPFGPAVEIFSYTEQDPNLVTQYQAVYNQFAGHRDQLDIGATNAPLLGVYCINCGVTGQFGISGSIDASLAKGLTQARFGVGANIAALANIGIQAYAMKELEKSFNLLRYPVGAWVIPGVVSFGPQFSLDVAGKISVSALGQLQAGASYTWNNAQTVLDFLDSSKSYQTNRRPTASAFYEVAGELSLEAQLGIPASLSMALQVFGKDVFSAGLVATPAVDAKASAGFEYNSTGIVPKKQADGSSCAGINYGVDVGTSLDFQVTGLKNVNLLTIPGPNLISGCTARPKRQMGARDDELVSAWDKELMAPRYERDVDHGRSVLRRSIRAGAIADLRTRQSTGDWNSTAGIPINHASIMDTTGKIGMYSSWDGNLFVAPANATNLTMVTGGSQLTQMTWNDKPVLLTDDRMRFIHYYPKTMDTLGISRIRLANWVHLPKSSRLIGLTPIKTKAGSLMVAIDATGKNYWLYSCAIQNQGNKMFLAKDSKNATQVLQNPDMRFIVTGGQASNCRPVAMNSVNLTMVATM